MEYNTQLKKLALPEYGRNLHKMVDHLKTIEDNDERNKAAKALISIMGNMNPHLRDVADFKHKLWDHLFIMADFDLDVECPYTIVSKSTLEQKPNQIPYNTQRLKFRHYGRVIYQMIERAIQYEEGEEKEILIRLIANHMKRTYITWNKDAVADSEIFKDMDEMAEGKLTIDKTMKLADIKEHKPNNNNNNNQRKNKKKGRK